MAGLEQFSYFFEGETGLFEDVGQGPFGERGMLRNNRAVGSVRSHFLKRYMAPSLPEHNEPSTLQGTHQPRSGHRRQLRHLSGNFHKGQKGLLADGLRFTPGFQVELDCFPEVGAGRLNIFALGGHTELRATGHVPVAFLGNQGRESVVVFGHESHANEAGAATQEPRGAR